MRPIYLSILAILSFATLSFGQTGPCPCCAEAYRAFDFWVGDWNVYTPDGKLAGTNSIAVSQDSCVLVENWKSAGGKFTGTSYNYYDQQSDTWHQVWVDNQGGSLRLAGKAGDGKMTLESQFEPSSSGPDAMNRITWTKNPDGSVRQLWESISRADSVSVLFDGLYKHVEN